MGEEQHSINNPFVKPSQFTQAFCISMASSAAPAGEMHWCVRLRGAARLLPFTGDMAECGSPRIRDIMASPV